MVGVHCQCSETVGVIFLNCVDIIVPYVDGSCFVLNCDVLDN